MNRESVTGLDDDALRSMTSLWKSMTALSH
jgi:hypothetical protein